MRTLRRAATLAATLAAAATPAVAQAHVDGHHGGRLHARHDQRAMRSFGDTFLTLDPAAASALQSLGVSPGLVGPAFAGPQGSLGFPITDAYGQVRHTGIVTHSGGISLTQGSTVVKLTDFDIDLNGTPSLSALVNGAQRVTILTLDTTGATVTRSHGMVITGPVTASLTQAAATALNAAFNTTAFQSGLVLGKATIVEKAGHGEYDGGRYDDGFGAADHHHDGDGNGNGQGENQDGDR